MNGQNGFQMRILTKKDIPGLINLSASIGWDYDEEEINTIMSVGTVFGHISEEGKIISSAAIIPYEDQLASLGMVIVNKNYRGYGLGKELTLTCMNSVSVDTPIMLIATNEGQPLYKKLGFQVSTYVHKFLCDQYNPHHFTHETNDYEICSLTITDFTQIIEMDQAAVGAERGYFLKERIRQAKEGVVVKRGNGEIVGYGLCIEGPVNLILGPIVAENYDVATLITHHFAKGYEGKLRIDVPDGQNSFLSFLELCGFNKVSQPPVMIRNSSQLPRRNNTLYGIAAQIFG